MEIQTHFLGTHRRYQPGQRSTKSVQMGPRWQQEPEAPVLEELNEISSLQTECS